MQQRQLQRRILKVLKSRKKEQKRIFKDNKELCYLIVILSEAKNLKWNLLGERIGKGYEG